ncbi:unnamed protein product [Prunus armeniaca]|uniref:Uncharacterized protein n=1 Tax=Prunus armeniaca TaxID=36596 RepID=A0A6J5XIQ2_PRUAR|nr:unnamed protein product [Prunus armeniaca]
MSIRTFHSRLCAIVSSECSQHYDLRQGLERVQDQAGEVDLSDIEARDRRQPPGVVIHLRRQEAL